MGCDIHFCVERRMPDGSWSAVMNRGLEWEMDRNYELFGRLAGVRCRERVIAEPRGIPADVSNVVRREYDGWGVDGHSASWLTLRELRDGIGADDFRQTMAQMGQIDMDPDRVRAVFWFDN